WPDEVKRHPPYTWSYSLHFIDIMDDPPKACGYLRDRDCPKGQCILGAVSNYTNQLACSTQQDRPRDEAVKFLVHFLGDLAQPLH
ncbi:S1/P1 nuclease, partial [Piptocephalis cylindrospora]